MHYVMVFMICVLVYFMFERFANFFLIDPEYEENTTERDIFLFLIVPLMLFMGVFIGVLYCF